MPVIRLSGHPNSGKTTFGSRAAEELGYQYFYAGGIMRTLAAERGMSIEEFYIVLENEPEIDKEVENRQEQLMQRQDNCLVEGRMAPHLRCAFPTINMLFTVDPAVAYERQHSREKYKDQPMSQIKRELDQRFASEKKRYRDLYKIEDFLDPRYFDIIIDTSLLNPDEVRAAAMLELFSRGIVPLK